MVVLSHTLETQVAQPVAVIARIWGTEYMGVLKKSEYLKMYIMKNMSEFQSFFFKQIEF